MPPRFTHFRVRSFGRRAFIKLGGTALAAWVLSACGADRHGDGAAGADAGQAVCTDALPDPSGPGADGRPTQSAAPPGGWGESIPPVTTNDRFFVTAWYGVEVIDPCTWRLNVTSLGVPVASIDIARLKALAPRDHEHTLECVDSLPSHQIIDNAVWGGLPLSEILKDADVTVPAGATHLRVTGADSHVAGLPIAVLQSPAWLVWRMNGEPLPAEHGFPARLLVPGRYGWQNVKSVVAIELLDDDPTPSFERDWPTEYRPKVLVVTPSSAGLINGGSTVRFLGKAFGGRDPVEWVGLSFDSGATVRDTELTYAPGPDRWTLWRYDWIPPAAGNYRVECHARLKSGARISPNPGDAIPYDGGMVLEVEVA